MLTDYPIAGIFSSCEREMQQQEYGYRILVQSQIIPLTFILRIWRAQGFNTDKNAKTFRKTQKKRPYTPL